MDFRYYIYSFFIEYYWGYSYQTLWALVMNAWFKLFTATTLYCSKYLRLVMFHICLLCYQNSGTNGFEIKSHSTKMLCFVFFIFCSKGANADNGIYGYRSICVLIISHKVLKLPSWRSVHRGKFCTLCVLSYVCGCQ